MLSVSDVLRGPTEHMKLVYSEGRETVEIEMQLYITNTCTFFYFIFTANVTASSVTEMTQVPVDYFLLTPSSSFFTLSP